MKPKPQPISTKADRVVRSLLQEDPQMSFKTMIQELVKRLNPNNKKPWRIPPEYWHALERVNLL